jgi:hypothetical protein
MRFGNTLTMVLMFLMEKNRLRDRFPDEEEEGA